MQIFIHKSLPLLCLLQEIIEFFSVSYEIFIFIFKVLCGGGFGGAGVPAPVGYSLQRLEAGKCVG